MNFDQWVKEVSRETLFVTEEEGERSFENTDSHRFWDFDEDEDLVMNAKEDQ